MTTDPDGAVVEIRTYKIRPGMAEKLDRLFREGAVPLLRRYGMDVVGCGLSLADDEHYVLVRRFHSLADHAEQTDRFYGSDDWRLGPREAIMQCVEGFHQVVLPETGEIIAALSVRDQPR